MSATTEEGERNAFAQLADGGRLAYRVRGAGRPLLLLRPLGGSMALWGRFADTLARAHRVIEFDPRGVGQSSDARWRETTRGMARDAVALLDRLKIDRPDVFGLSLGGMVASWLAIDAPERVARLILASTLPRASELSKRVVAPVRRWARALFHEELEVALVDGILSPRFVAEEPARRQAILTAVRQHPTARANLLKLGLAAAGHDAERQLRRITAPTLILVGDHDSIAGSRSQAELLFDIPGARLNRVAHSGHDVSLEQPLVTAQLVEEFLRDGGS